MICCDPKFDIAKFRHRIQFQTLSLTPNDSGGQIETWTTFTTVWASIEPKIVKEVNFAQRIEPRTDHIVRCRYFAGLNASMRILFGARTFEVKAFVIPEEVKEFYEILATERTGT